MYVSYNYLNSFNIRSTEGVGSQYQKIINLYAVIKKFNLKYIHIPIQIGHNYNNDKNWNEKWDIFFNFKKLSNNDEIDIEKQEKYFITEHNTIEATIFRNRNPDILYLYSHTYNIFYKNPEYYFKDIQNDLIDAYDDANNHRTLIYNKTKTNIAIHIRVYNNYDNEDDNTYYDRYSKENTTDAKFNFTADMYENLINQLKEKYTNTEIHIFSQKEYFNIKFKKLRDIKDIKLHFDDMDVFDTFHHMCKADVFVMGLSSFSILAAYYNKNTVIYLPYIYPPVLKSWQICYK